MLKPNFDPLSPTTPSDETRCRAIGGRGGGSKGGSELRVLVERGMIRGTNVMDVSSAMARGNRYQQRKPKGTNLNLDH